MIQSKKVSSATNERHLFWTKLWQAGPAVVLNTTFFVNKLYQFRRIISLGGVNGMRVPAHLKIEKLLFNN